MHQPAYISQAIKKTMARTFAFRIGSCGNNGFSGKTSSKNSKIAGDSINTSPVDHCKAGMSPKGCILR